MVIATIDEASLGAFGQWPWPRTRIAELCRKLTAAGAAAIALDIVFAEPDRLSPPRLALTLPDLPQGVRSELMAQPSNDDLLADAIAQGRVVLGQTAATQVLAWPDAQPPPQTGVAVVGVDPDPRRALLAFPGLVRNVPVLERAAAGRGVFTLSPERDGVVRRVPLIVNAGGAVVPSLALEVVRVITDANGILVRTDEAGVSSVRVPGLVLPTDPRGQVWVRFSRHDPSKFISVADILADRVTPDRLRDKIVLVGTSAIGLFDNRTTPVDRTMPGVEVHAQLLENILGGTTLTVPHDALLIELLAATTVSLGIIVVAPALSALSLLVLGGGVAALLSIVSWYRFSEQGVLLDATFPLATAFLVYLTIVFTNYLREQLGRARIRAAFGKYLSPALVEQLVASPELLRLGGEERRLTVMFSDVRGFTAIAEFYKNDPAGLTHLMNRFLTPLTNAILGARGTIDKYMGDAIMAFWNAPLDDAHQEAHAAQAALDMLERMEALNLVRREEAKAAGHPVLPIDIGIGLNTGPCVVGNMGSDQRFDYSVLGDTVNIASRLEGQSKYYGATIVLGSETAQAICDLYPMLELDLVQVKGKREPERIWALVGGRSFRRSEEFLRLAARHSAMLAAYRTREWERTRALAQECLALVQTLPQVPAFAGVYRLYQRRANDFRDAPPPEDWLGVHVAESK